MQLLRTTTLLFLLVIVGCGDLFDPEGSVRTVDVESTGPWAVPSDHVFRGGPGKDGIPAIDQPEMFAVEGITYLNDDDLVVGVLIGGQALAYPHKVLNWHEIANDHAGNTYFAVSYCPLTGSALCWDRTLDGEVTTFGVSGLLYNSNLIPYDRRTNSYWSQMLIKGIHGKFKGAPASTYQVMETSWSTWKALFPQSTVLSTETSYIRDYSRNPYRGYPEGEFLMFPIDVDDNRLHRKERVLGIVEDGQARVYRLSSFTGGVGTINGDYMEQPVVVAGSDDSNFMVAFSRRTATGKVLTFTPLQGQLPTVMLDNEGTSWDVFGRGVSGPGAGQQLARFESFIAYWFAFGTFYPGAEIYSN